MAEICVRAAHRLWSRCLITHHQLYGEICSFANLLSAAHQAEHGKRMQDTIGRFRTDLETELLQLRRELVTQSYTPGPYRETIITRPKRRMISAAPFRDRVVHHAVCNVVMPLFERKMIFDLHSTQIVRAREPTRPSGGRNIFAANSIMS